ncbi:protein ren [Enterobacter mori]|uniref:protein ren n=1 Tax=Enterobacter mori TaxID=539813 RepID=UPI001BDFC8A2|nr:protein ren [Enterobacter mori]MBT1882984.1 protein ren [Enterobacter mori]
MTGREAIEWYLEQYGSFTAELVSTATGVSRTQVQSASYRMRANGEIILRERNWRTMVYVAAEDDEGAPNNRDGENTIFQECRNSAAMKRVLMVWGRVGV